MREERDGRLPRLIRRAVSLIPGFVFILGPRAEPPVGSTGDVKVLASSPRVPDQLGALRLRGGAHQSERSLRTSKPRLTRGHLLLELIPVLLDALVVFDPLRLVVLPRERCLLYTSPSPRDATLSRMPSSA